MKAKIQADWRLINIANALLGLQSQRNQARSRIKRSSSTPLNPAALLWKPLKIQRMLNTIPVQLLGHAPVLYWDHPTPTNEIPHHPQSTRTTVTLLVAPNMTTIPMSQFYALLTSGRESSKPKSSPCLQLPPQMLMTALPAIKLSNIVKRMQRVTLRLRGGKGRKLTRKRHGIHLTRPAGK